MTERHLHTFVIQHVVDPEEVQKASKMGTRYTPPSFMRRHRLDVAAVEHYTESEIEFEGQMLPAVTVHLVTLETRSILTDYREFTKIFDKVQKDMHAELCATESTNCTGCSV